MASGKAVSSAIRQIQRIVLTMKVKTAMISVHRVIKEKAAQSQSEALVLMCSCALGGFEPSASFLRTSHSGTNMAGVEDERELMEESRVEVRWVLEV